MEMETTTIEVYEFIKNLRNEINELDNELTITPVLDNKDISIKALDLVEMLKQTNLSQTLKDLYESALTMDTLKVIELDLKLKRLMGNIEKDSEFLEHTQKVLDDEVNAPEYNKEQAQEVAQKIQKYGLINYLDYNISKIRKGNNKNIIRKILVGFNVISGRGSYLCETIADSGEGKSLEDEIAFLMSMPQEYIFRKDSMTLASFTRYPTSYFNRKIIYFGDLGNSKTMEQLEPVFDIAKKLITEKYYSRDVCEGQGSKQEIKTLELEVESIGGVYSSIDNNATKGDEQLISRTVNFTPMETNEMTVLEYMFDVSQELSKEYKEREQAKAELKKFAEYQKMLIKNNIKVINPFKRPFIEYALTSQTPKRELTQQKELFEGFCILSNYNCKEYNDNYVATQKQFKEYFNQIALENALIPYENDFLKMVWAKGKKYELKIIDDNPEQNENDEINLKFSRVLEDMEVYSFEDLDDRQEKIFAKKLIQYYGVNGKSLEHKEDIFFTYNSIKRLYSRYKAFKNVADFKSLMSKLYKMDYIGKLEVKYKNQSIYYLTPKVQEINIEMDLTKDDIIEANNYLAKLEII